MATTSSSEFLKDKSSSSMDVRHCYHQTAEHFIDEHYPKTCLETIPSIILEHPRRKVNCQLSRSRHNLRFRTQPVTLAEIYETDEENKIENDNQQDSKAKVINDYDRWGYLSLAENLRQQTTRKKVPLKNFLKQQRLKTTQEELFETDGS
ncbi:unnamed protein product [Rotaria socialis]|uniref:Uncharacterized protein n=1 Tax=Rotaria socialis TaxID=392032 RepID=A0A820F206_9BILA|nr:unnamed protein product [Rotaria socialis]CAF4257443.1 unnamed protein product [Rotaria socialis]